VNKLEMTKRWRINNKEYVSSYNSQWAKENADKRRINQALYRQRHPGKVNADTAKRDAAKKQRTPKWLTKTQWKDITQYYIDAAYIGQLMQVEMEVDHIVPILGKNVSGLHVPWNLQILTAKENSSKGNR